MERMHEFEVPEQMKERIRFLVERMIQQAGQPDWQEARATLKHLARKLENLKDLRVEGENDRTEYQKRKQEIEAQIRKAQETVRGAPTDVKDVEDLLSKVDRIAEVISEGSLEYKKRLFNNLLERIEQCDGKVTRFVPREWARPFFQDTE